MKKTSTKTTTTYYLYINGSKRGFLGVQADAKTLQTLLKQHQQANPGATCEYRTK